MGHGEAATPSDKCSASLEVGAAATAAFLTVRPATPNAATPPVSISAPRPVPHLQADALEGGPDALFTDGEAQISPSEGGAEGAGLCFHSPDTPQSCSKAGGDGTQPAVFRPGFVLKNLAKAHAGRKQGGGTAEEESPSPREFSIKAHYPGGIPVAPRTSSMLSSRIAMFEAGAGGSEGGQVFQTPHKGPAVGSGRGEASSKARLADMPPFSVQEIRRKLGEPAATNPAGVALTPRAGPPCPSLLHLLLFLPPEGSTQRAPL